MRARTDNTETSPVNVLSPTTLEIHHQRVPSAYKDHSTRQPQSLPELIRVRDAVWRSFVNKGGVSNADFTSPSPSAPPNHLSPREREGSGVWMGGIQYHIVHSRLSSFLGNSQYYIRYNELEWRESSRNAQL